MNNSEIYIIKISAYRESSNLYDAIAKDYGKITLIHKGIKTNKKNFQLELFTSYNVSWSGKGDIKFLQSFEINSENVLDKKYYVIGMYFNELIYHLIKNDYQIEKLYDHYFLSLNQLKLSDHFLKTLNNYEIGLLSLAGNYLNFDSDINGKGIDKNLKYFYIPEEGPKISSNENEHYSGETFLALSGKVSYNKKTLRESRLLMKRLIDYYIRPKKIKTREILQFTKFDY